jgi:hypothetical protein
MDEENSTSKLIVRGSEETLALFEEACVWARIEKGRCLQYSRLFSEFKKGEISQQHIYAFFELMDIIDIYNHWRLHIANFQDLVEKIEHAFTKGPVLTDHENPATGTNQARNTVFTILLAGRLLSAGISVIVVEGVKRKGYAGRIESAFPSSAPLDVVIEGNGAFLVIECKRPFSGKAIRKSVKEARRQITQARSSGIIALDCSTVIRPTESILHVLPEQDPTDFISKKLVEVAKPAVEQEFRPNILGAILYARVPTHTVQPSAVLGPRGKPVESIRQDSVHSITVLANTSSAQWSALKSICNALVSTP